MKVKNFTLILGLSVLQTSCRKDSQTLIERADRIAIFSISPLENMEPLLDILGQMPFVIEEIGLWLSDNFSI